MPYLVVESNYYDTHTGKETTATLECRWFDMLYEAKLEQERQWKRHFPFGTERANVEIRRTSEKTHVKFKHDTPEAPIMHNRVYAERVFYISYVKPF